MSELSDRDVDLFERVRSTYAEIDPVPEDVVAAARAALGGGSRRPPSMPSSRSSSRTPRRPPSPVFAAPSYHDSSPSKANR